MKFKEDDYVKIKDGIILKETGEKTQGWEGVVLNAEAEDGAYLIDLAPQVLSSLSDAYLKALLSKDMDFSERLFNENELSLAEKPADYPRTHKAAMEKVDNRAFAFLAEKEEYHEIEDVLLRRKQHRWYDDFRASEYYNRLTELQKKSDNFAIECFHNYASEHLGETVDDWDADTVYELCLDILPRKVSGGKELFENYVPILEVYFEFLGKEKNLPSAPSLLRVLQKIGGRMARLAADPKNWDMAKSMMMQVFAKGFDPNNFTSREEFQAALKKEFEIIHQERQHPIEQRVSINSSRQDSSHRPYVNPLKAIGRNDLVTVKYINGKVVQGVKFKKVKQDLEEGVCKLFTL